MNRREFFEYYKDKILLHPLSSLRLHKQFIEDSKDLFLNDIQLSESIRNFRRTHTKHIDKVKIPIKELKKETRKTTKLINKIIKPTVEIIEQEPEIVEKEFIFKLDINDKVLKTLNKDLHFLQHIQESKDVSNDKEIQGFKKIYKNAITKAINTLNDLVNEGFDNLQEKDVKNITTTVQAMGDLYTRLKTIKHYDHINDCTKQYEMISAKSEAMLNITKNVNITISTEGLASQNLQNIKQVDEIDGLLAIDEIEEMFDK